MFASFILGLPINVHTLTAKEKAAFLDSHVSITEKNGQITLKSNGMPDHDHGPFPSRVSDENAPTHTHAHTHTHSHTRRGKHIHVHRHPHTHPHTPSHTHTDTLTHTHTHIHTMS